MRIVLMLVASALALILFIVFLISSDAEPLPSTGVATEEIPSSEGTAAVEESSLIVERSDLESNPDGLLRGRRPQAPEPTPLPFKGEEKLLAAGRVVDKYGYPVEGIVIHFQYGILRQGDDPAGEPSYTWRRDRNLRTQTGEDGRYRLHGGAEGRTYRLSVLDDEHLPVKMEFAYGAEGVDVILHRSWAIGGLVLLDEDVNDQRMAVHVERIGEGPAEESTRQDRLNTRGGWKLEGLGEGLHVLTLRHAWGSSPLYSREILLSAEGGRERQPDIDLRGAIRSIGLTLRGTDGKVLDGGWAVSMEGMAWPNRATGVLTLLQSDQPIDLVVGSRGYRTTRLYGVTEDVEITLERGIEIQVQLDLPKVPREWSWYAYLRPMDDSDLEPETVRDRSTTLVGRGDATVFMPHAGRFQLEVQLINIANVLDTSGGGLAPPDALAGDAGLPTWEIQDIAGPQAFHYTLTGQEAWIDQVIGAGGGD